MKKIFLSIVGLITILNLFAQEKQVQQLKPAESISSGAYRFPHFIHGSVHYNNGNTSTAMLNFYLVSEEMHFIDYKGDTLAIASPQNITSIVLDSTIYYYIKNDYLEVLSHYGSIQLAGKLRMKTRNAKMGAYGQVNETSSIDAYNSINDRNRIYTLTPNEQVKLSLSITYYFIDHNRNVLKANKQSLLKLYPDKKDSIERYCNEHAINFSDKADIHRLLLHCQLLVQSVSS
jgi:hypothetical protein